MKILTLECNQSTSNVVNTLFKDSFKLSNKLRLLRIGKVACVTPDSDLAVISMCYHTDSATQVPSPGHQIVKLPHLEALEAPRLPGSWHTAEHSGVVGTYVPRTALHIVPQQ